MLLKRFDDAYQLIFLSLMKDGPVYGYELEGLVEKMSRGHIKVSYGTIYPFLRRTEKAGLVKSRKDESSGRVYYELTQKGKITLRDLSDKLEEYQEEFDEKVLGILAIYSGLFGRRALNRVLSRIE